MLTFYFVQPSILSTHCLLWFPSPPGISSALYACWTNMLLRQGKGLLENMPRVFIISAYVFDSVL